MIGNGDALNLTSLVHIDAGGRALAGIAVSNSAAGINVCLLYIVCSSGTGLCDGPVTCPEEAYRICVIECDQMQQ